MLIVFQRGPVSTPAKTFCREYLVAKVLLVYLACKLPFSVYVFAGSRWLDYRLAVGSWVHTGIDEWIDVNRQASRMLGEGFLACHSPEAEARGVVGLHGAFVVGIEIVDETNALYGIFLLEEFFENLCQALGYGLMAYQFASQHFSLEVVVKQLQIAQIAARHRAGGGKTLSLHAEEDSIGNGQRAEGAFG